MVYNERFKHFLVAQSAPASKYMHTSTSTDILHTYGSMQAARTFKHTHGMIGNA